MNFMVIIVDVKIEAGRRLSRIPPRATLRPSQVDTLQHERQLGRLHFHVRRRRVHFHRKPERSPLEPFVTQCRMQPVPSPGRTLCR